MPHRRGAPREDGLPPREEDNTRNNAVREILERAGLGLYDDEEEFQRDLDSISCWYDSGQRNPELCRFDPPAPFNCRDYVRRQPDECDTPCVFGPRSCVPSSLDDQTSRRAYHRWWIEDENLLDAGIDENVDLLLAQAWALLQENLDIIDWLTCIHYGEPYLASPFQQPLVAAAQLVLQIPVDDCLRRKISGDAMSRVNIVFKDDVGPAFRASPSYFGIPARAGGRIEIPRSGSVWGRYLDAYRTSSAEEKFCIILDFAATLLHELVHVCTPFNLRDLGDAADRCAPTYLIENGFRWAMAQRYPCISGTSCGFFSNPRMWGHSDATYFFSPPRAVDASPYRPRTIRR